MADSAGTAQAPERSYHIVRGNPLRFINDDDAVGSGGAARRAGLGAGFTSACRRLVFVTV